MDIWFWFIQLQPQVQAAIVGGLVALLNICVSWRSFVNTRKLNEKNLEITQKKFENEVKKVFEDERQFSINHQLKIVSEIKEKKDYFSSMIKICYRINSIHGSATDYRENLGLGLSEKTLNTEWIKKDYEKIENLLSDLDFYISKSFNFIGERDTGKNFVWIQKHNYDYLYNKVLSEYFLNSSEGKISNPKSAKICQYIDQIYNNNIQFIGFIDDCLSGCIKNLGLNAENDMNYLIGRYPLRMEIGKEAFKNTTEEVSAIEKWGALKRLATTNVDFDGYMDYRKEEKIEEFETKLQAQDFLAVGEILLSNLEYFNINLVLHALHGMKEHNTILWSTYTPWFELLSHWENQVNCDQTLVNKIIDYIPDVILGQFLAQFQIDPRENENYYLNSEKILKAHPSLYHKIINIQTSNPYSPDDNSLCYSYDKEKGYVEYLFNKM